MDALQMLRDDHRVVEDLFQTLRIAEDPQHKRNLLEQLKTELDNHTAIEEEHLYPALLQYDETRRIVEDGYNEHNRAKDHIRRMKEMDVNSLEWGGEYDELRSVIQNHIGDEENELFPKASQLLSQEQISDIGNRMYEQKQQLQGEVVASWESAEFGSEESIQEEYTETTAQPGWVSEAQQRGKSMLTDQIRNAAEPVHGIARAVHSTADNLQQQNNPQLSQYAHMAAQRIDDIANRMEAGDIDNIVGNISNYARQHPAIFIGGAVAAGFALSRFFKSSESHVTGVQLH